MMGVMSSPVAVRYLVNAIKTVPAMNTDLRLRPNNNYLHTATWQELYALTEHWLSDVAFFGDEVRFLSDLVGKYFIWLTRQESMMTVQRMVTRLNAFARTQKEIADRIKRHLKDLGVLMDGIDREDAKNFRFEHARLEEDLAELARVFRSVKKEVFTITEHVVESEKLQNLLEP